MHKLLLALSLIVFLASLSQKTKAQTDQSVIAGAASGNIYACVGAASANPQLQQFTVSGNNLTSAVTATASAGFEVSLNPANGYGNSVTLNPVNGTLGAGISVYVRSAASAALGYISGNITLSSAGVADQAVAVSAVINALPTVNPVANQTAANGSTTAAINFSGSANTSFNWVNNTPGIGLPAAGTGTIGSFTAVNNGASPVVATITATPVSEGFAYITNEGNGNISVINVATNTVVSTITPRGDPFAVCISPDGSKAYVGCGGGSNTIAVVSTATNQIINTIIVNTNGENTGVTISPDGNTLYATDYQFGTVSVINLTTGAVAAVIQVGQNPLGIVTSPDGSKVYVAYSYTNYITVINTATNTVAANITVGSTPYGIAMGPDGKVYVSVFESNHIAVIDPATNTIIKVIPTGAGAGAIGLSPNGTLAYVSAGSNLIAVVNTVTGAILATVTIDSFPNSICVSPDGRFVYVTDSGTNDVSVINTATNTVIATVPVGSTPDSIGDFVTGGTNCPGMPITFTITVNPTVPVTPTITAGNASGSIYACAGAASASPNVQQFTIYGSNLTGDITATAPAGFEMSTNINSGYVSTLKLAQTGGAVANTIIYIRSAATAPAGSLTGQVALSSTGAPNINVAVQGIVYQGATVNAVSSQTVGNGDQTTAINFSGTATNYTWVNDTPGIGLAASGSGDIAPFTAVNPGASPIIATLTVTPANSSADGSFSCTGTPVIFTITVNPTLPPAITATGTLQALTTTYGTPSPSTMLEVSGTSLTAGILITPPAGFEVSTDNITFTGTITFGTSGNTPVTPVYIRLAAITPAGQYSGNIVLSSGSLSPVDVFMPTSSVNPALLTIIADNKSKVYGAVNPVLTLSYTGFVNHEDAVQLTVQPQVNTAATTTSPVGVYPIVASGASSPDYTFAYVNGLITVDPPSLIIPDAFTPNGDGINDTWNIKYIENYPNSTVQIFNRYGEKLYSSIGYPVAWNGSYKGTNLPTGTYYYIIDTKSNLKTFAGYVAIIR